MLGLDIWAKYSQNILKLHTLNLYTLISSRDQLHPIYKFRDIFCISDIVSPF